MAQNVTLPVTRQQAAPAEFNPLVPVLFIVAGLLAIWALGVFAPDLATALAGPVAAL